MPVEDTLRDRMLAAVPKLRAFAISLTGHRDRADDLVQDTLVRAWANMDRFERGTNLEAWLFTILRNRFHSEYRRRKREVDDADGSDAARLKTRPGQHAHLDYEDFLTVLAKLPPDQREALLLVGRRAYPMRRRQRCATCLWAPSRAGSTAPGADWQNCSISTAKPRSDLTI